MREGFSRETGNSAGTAAFSARGRAVAAFAAVILGEIDGIGESAGTDKVADKELEGRATFVIGPGTTPDIAADAAPADELGAATEEAIFTWEKADEGLRASQRATRIEGRGFTLTEYPPFHL